MPNKVVKVTIRLPETQLKKLDEFVEQGKYDNRSQAIRQAIGNEVQDKINYSNAEKVIVQLSKNEMKNLDALVGKGEALDRQDGLRIALRYYVYSVLTCKK